MSEEKWDRFAVTGSVRDYLEYRSCISEEIRGTGRCDVERERSGFGQTKAAAVENESKLDVMSG